LTERLKQTILGKEFKNPILLASGTAGFGFALDRVYKANGHPDGIESLGGIVGKGLTGQPRMGNPNPRSAETKGGMINSIGLENMGIDEFVSRYHDAFVNQDLVTIANICGFTIEEYQQVAEKLAQTDVDMLEVNISCPNVKQGGIAFSATPKSVFDTVKAIEPHCGNKKMIVKLSPATADMGANAQAALDGGADAISLINTIPAMPIDWRTGEPKLGNVVGGMSGPSIKEAALKLVFDAYRAVGKEIPIIGMGGIADFHDVMEFMSAGASLVQIGTSNMINWDAPQIVNDLEQWFIEDDIQHPSEIIGRTKTIIDERNK